LCRRPSTVRDISLRSRRTDRVRPAGQTNARHTVHSPRLESRNATVGVLACARCAHLAAAWATRQARPPGPFSRPVVLACRARGGARAGDAPAHASQIALEPSPMLCRPRRHVIRAARTSGCYLGSPRPCPRMTGPPVSSEMRHELVAADAVAMHSRPTDSFTMLPRTPSRKSPHTPSFPSMPPSSPPPPASPAAAHSQ